MHEGGTTPQCFERKAVTFNTCKNLLKLRQKDGCNALTYSHYSCTLHDRSLPSWKPGYLLSEGNEPPRKTVSNAGIGVRLYNHTVRNLPMLQMLLLSPAIDLCTVSMYPNTVGWKAVDELPACLLQGPLLAPQAENIPEVMDISVMKSGLQRWLSLPRLGIVMAVTIDWMRSNQAEVRSLADNWACYAKTHNYTFVSDRIYNRSLCSFI